MSRYRVRDFLAVFGLLALGLLVLGASPAVNELIDGQAALKTEISTAHNETLDTINLTHNETLNTINTDHNETLSAIVSSSSRVVENVNDFTGVEVQDLKATTLKDKMDLSDMINEST